MALHSSFVPGIEDAIGEDDALFLGMTAIGPEREDVGLVITRSPTGEHHFVGECMAQGETLLRERLEGRFDRVIARVIGITDPERTLTLLEAS